MTALHEHVEHFGRRVLQEALADATRTHWLQRAADFEWARPRPDDYTGLATPEQINALDKRLEEQAEACRVRAAVSVVQDLEAVA